MKKLIYGFLTVLVCATSVFAQQTVANAQDQSGLMSVSGVVLDGQGNPLPDVLVLAESGKQKTRTDVNGRFSVKSSAGSDIYFVADDYDEMAFPASEIIGTGKVVITGSPYQMSDKDVFDMTFVDQIKKYNTGAVSVLDMEGMHTYDSQDYITPLIESRILGASSSNGIRGNGVLYVVDGFIRDENFVNLLDAKEVEEITVLKDAVSRILYGVYADKVIVQIKTKRGKIGHRDINVNMRTGIATPTARPEYMNSADYMTYYNYARLGDGLTPLYTEEQIANSRAGQDPVGYPDIDLYSSEFLRKVKPFSSIDVDFTGGTKVAQYYLSMGWNNENSYLNVGQKTQSNVFNLKGNLDIHVTDFLTVTFDATAIFDRDSSPMYGEKNFWQMASELRPNQFPLLIPKDMVSIDSEDLVNGATLIDGKYLLGGSSLYQQNPYGDLMLGGYSKTNNSNIQVNAALDFDLGSILPGLSFKTKLGYDDVSVYAIQIKNTYAVYEPTFDGYQYTLKKINNDMFNGEQEVSNTSFSRRLAWNNVLRWNRNIGRHHIDAAAISFIDTYKVNNDLYTVKHANFGLKANYAYAQKYLFDAALSYTGSSKLGYKWGLAPSFGLGWVMSEENFMKAAAPVISWAKLKASYGKILSDNSLDSYYYTQDIFSLGWKYNYADNASGNEFLNLLTLGNPDLFFTQRHEVNAGLELGFFDNTLMFEGNYFFVNDSGKLSQRTNNTPGYLGGSVFSPYYNYENTLTNGYELGLSFNKNIGKDWSVNAGLRMLYYKSVYGQVDEQLYETEEDRLNLSLSGRPVDMIRILQADGFYTEQDLLQLEITGGSPDLPMPTFGTFGVGDIKYLGGNSDNVIDWRDVQEMGNSTPRYTFALDFNVRWKNIEVYAFLRSQLGFYGTYQNNSYWGYISEMQKYPEHLKNAWIYLPEYGIDTRETAIYPRLSSLASNHNKQASSFWLVKKDFLSMPELQITYHLPYRFVKKIGMSQASVYARATNLFHLSADREMVLLTIGDELQSRYFTLGLNVRF